MYLQNTQEEKKKKSKNPKLKCCISESACINMDSNSQYEDGEDAKENESVDEYGFSIGCEASKFHMVGVSW